MNEPRDMSVADPPGAFRGCPELEDLASYVDGRLDGPARGRFEEHVADCDRCRELLAEVARTPEVSAAGTVVPMRPRRVSRRIWVGGGILAAAASVVLAIKVIEMRRGPAGEMPELRELVAAVSNEPTRPTEGRLTGGFGYAPPPSPLRGSRANEPSPDTRVAALRLETRAAANGSAGAQSAQGLASLVLGEWEKGTAALERAASEEPGNARIHSDLSAAYLARGTAGGGAADYVKALDSARRATDADASLLEPRFNHALALEALGRTDEARRAWRDYLQRDAASRWADEARARLHRLDTPPLRQDLP